ncbi:MAG: magnesium and cobalt transport protein CorA [Nitrospirae bacterium RBG_13_39_12]|nr:MAG: magnesium and cobalt transport protein CorA [Nitrospirae bacterium RBG_13_39_12]
MVRQIKGRSKKSGLPPGTPVHVGDRKTEIIKISLIDYDKESFEMRVTQTVEECFAYKGKPTVTWINVDGLHEVSSVEQLGNCFGLHPLTIEDILNTEQRPKLDVFDTYIFIVVKMHTWNEKTKEITGEQMSLILGDNFVITFQEKEGDIFDEVRNRIKNNKGRIRKSGADYLAYSLMDALVDNYFRVLESIGEDIEEMDEELIKNPTPRTLHKIHFLKREMIFLRKTVWPIREVISRLVREETGLIKDSTKIYLRDIYDHIIQIIDTVETYRDVISGMLDVYLSSISNRMNAVMKVLTIFAAIFIPLTFIVGLYGMNFNTEKSPYNMPELNWYYGYPVALGLMLFVSLIMLFLFKKKKWF